MRPSVPLRQRDWRPRPLEAKPHDRSAERRRGAVPRAAPLGREFPGEIPQFIQPVNGEKLETHNYRE